MPDSASVQGSVHNVYQFPRMYDGTAPQHNELPEHTPAPKAAGPEEAKNAHVQKLNEKSRGYSGGGRVGCRIWQKIKRGCSS